jgi:hypothetical protein
MDLMGWSQTEAALRLRRTPSAINRLINPDHPNKPTQTTLALLKLIMARESPDLVDTQTCELKEAPIGAKSHAMQLSPKEREMIQSMRHLPPGEREKVYAVIKALLRATGRKGGKTRQ